MMETYFTSGTATVVILLAMAVEALVLARWFKLAPAMMWGLAAGATMVLALSASFMQYSFEWIAVLLALSFVFHLVEVRLWLKTAKRLPA